MIQDEMEHENLDIRNKSELIHQLNIQVSHYIILSE